jgi:hypothetical protein
MNRDCEFTLDVLDEALAGRLEAESQARLRAHLAECAECAAKMDDARFVRGLFTAVQSPRCPDHVVDSILEVADVPRRIPSGSTVAPTGRWLRHSVSWPWMGGVAAAAVALVALLLPMHMTSETAEAPPSLAEVADAAQQLELAFSVVSREMSRTTEILGAEIGAQMSRSIRTGMSRAGRAFLPPAPSEDDRQGRTGFPPDEHWLDTKPTWKG